MSPNLLVNTDACADTVEHFVLLESAVTVLAVARAAVLDGDPVAQKLLDLVKEGRAHEVAGEQQFAELLDRLTPSNEVTDLAVELYNGHLWGSDPIAQRRNIVAAAVAHYQSRKPIDKLAAFAGLSTSATTRGRGRSDPSRRSPRPV